MPASSFFSDIFASGDGGGGGGGGSPQVSPPLGLRDSPSYLQNTHHLRRKGGRERGRKEQPWKKEEEGNLERERKNLVLEGEKPITKGRG